MMTTNYTRILNDNLDMISGYDYPADMIEMDNGDLLTHDEYISYIYGDRWDEEEPDDEPTNFIDGKPVSDAEFLAHIRATLVRIAEEQGEDSDEFRDEYSFSSDVYKDIHGIRPHGYKLTLFGD